jgi:ABC-type uncharacterized transport system permease subunit
MLSDSLLRLLAIAAALSMGLVIWFIFESCPNGFKAEVCGFNWRLSVYIWPVLTGVFFLALLLFRLVKNWLIPTSIDRNLDSKNE